MFVPQNVANFESSMWFFIQPCAFAKVEHTMKAIFKVLAQVFYIIRDSNMLFTTMQFYVLNDCANKK